MSVKNDAYGGFEQSNTLAFLNAYVLEITQRAVRCLSSLKPRPRLFGATLLVPSLSALAACYPSHFNLTQLGSCAQIRWLGGLLPDPARSHLIIANS